MRISDPSGAYAPRAGQPARRLRARLTRFTAMALGLVTFAPLLAACELAGAEADAPTPQRGGTLYVNLQGGLDILDPQRTYSASEMNVLRLLNRTLTTYRSEPGPAGSEIVGDLATDTGRPSENNTVWQFTLKPGLRWENGEPLVCSHVKYGIERRFSTLMDEGASYPKDYLVDNPTPYQGPWVGGNNDGKGLESITCLDEFNIVFRLNRPVGDFGYAVALSTFAPVLPEKDTKQDYAKRPYSNGPYKIESRDENQLTLVRNRFWSPENDQVRKAYPDKIVFDFRPDTSGVVTNELIEDSGNARNTVMLDGNVAPNFLQQVVNDPELITRTLSGPTGAVRYMAINTRMVPNLACRQALIYAFNKRKYRAVNGGSVTGDYATTMIPPELKAHKSFDLYDSLQNPEGDPQRTITIYQEQEAAGDPCPATIRVAFPDTPIRRRLMNTVAEAYQLAGIQVELVGLPPATYFNTGIGDPTNEYHMMLVGWIPDWANGSAIIPPIFDGDVIPEINPVTGKAAGNVNHALLDDPEINEMIDVALAETDRERAYTLWGELDQRIQEKAVTIPILYEKALRLTGSNVLGGFIHPAYGMPDLCSLGLAQP
ncbi:MAG TPA: ABC transporter substrate-binding protein [Micromonosporaceae bacterium]|nr:ABC transporter substrate-binding protein [Micromonosporaceae bacterium]